MNKQRILIVDDEQGFIRLLKLVLEKTGRFLVREEIDATKAVEVAHEFHPDLVLMDSVMPKIDGATVAEALRAEPRFAQTPILFLSATVIEYNGSPAQIAGFPALAKPIAVQDLVRAIEEKLGTSA